MSDNLPPLPEPRGLLDTGGGWMAPTKLFTPEQMQAYASAAIEANTPAVPDGPPFGSKRNAALALYRPPFRFLHGYIYDADGKMCADEGEMPDHVAARVRGWGRIGYLPDAAALQDEVGQVIAEALTAFWLAAAPRPQPVAQPVQAQPSELERMRHIANEWADMATNGLQWIRNIADGTSLPAVALENMESNLKHCRLVNDATGAYGLQPKPANQQKE